MLRMLRIDRMLLLSTAVLPVVIALIIVTEAAHGGSGELSPLERGDHPPDSPLVMQLKLPQCRENCMDKHNVDDLMCLQIAECSFCLNRCFALEHNTIPDAAPLQPPPPPSAAHPDVVRLHTDALVRDRSLVSADIRWRWPAAAAGTPQWHCTGGQCLVTWDVLGGGLMGHLLTDVPEVQLSLWPLTVYHIQVTCKCKDNGVIFKSLPLTIDTSQAIDVTSTTTTAAPTTTAQPTTTSTTTTTTTTQQITQKSWQHSTISSQPAKSYHKDIIRKYHHHLKPVHANEILPHQQQQKQQQPLQQHSSDAVPALRTHRRLGLEVLLAVGLAGVAMLCVWLVLLRLCDNDATSSGASTAKAEGRVTATIGRDQTLWIGGGGSGPDGDDVMMTVTEKRNAAVGVDEPLMRVIHV